MGKARSNFAKSCKGVAGVHLVVAQLSLRGCVALATIRNQKGVDLVVFNEDFSQFAFVQVKSTDKPKQGWMVHNIRKEDDWEEDVRDALSLGARFYYVFVSLPNSAQTDPLYYIVPSADLAQHVIDGHKQWLAGKTGRKICQPCAWGYAGLSAEVTQKYQGKWDLLKLQAEAR